MFPVISIFMNFCPARGLTSPHFPGRFAGGPELLEIHLVPQRIHVLPEAPMTIGGELSFTGQRFHGLTFPDGGLVCNVVHRARFQNKESPVDPARTALRLFLETGDSSLFVLEAKGAKPAWRLHRRQCGQGALLAMEGNQVLDVEVAHAIPVGEAEGVVADVAAHALEPASGHRGFAGIDQRNLPGLHAVVEDLHFVVLHVEGHVGHVEEVVGEVLFDEITLVAAADNEVIDPVEGVQLHDMPQNRLSADFDHWFRLDLCFLAQSGAKTASQDYRFHAAASSLSHTLTQAFYAGGTAEVEQIEGQLSPRCSWLLDGGRTLHIYSYQLVMGNHGSCPTRS